MSAAELCPRWAGEKCRLFNCGACEGYETRDDALRAQASRRLHALEGASEELERRRRKRLRDLLGLRPDDEMDEDALEQASDSARAYARDRCWATLRVELEAALLEHGQYLLDLHDAWLTEWAAKWKREAAQGASHA